MPIILATSPQGVAVPKCCAAKGAVAVANRHDMVINAIGQWKIQCLFAGSRLARDSYQMTKIAVAAKLN